MSERSAAGDFSSADEDRASTIERVLQSHIQRRFEGEDVNDDELIAEHQELMPELADELRLIREISDQRDANAARESADSDAAPRDLIVRCPNCRESVRLSADALISDIVCDNCGSRFSLADDPQKTQSRAASLTKRLGHFELIEQIGLGSFGCVWKARDTELDRFVAIKIPRQGKLDSTEVEHFLREARAAAQLSHPNIVSVYEVGRDGETVFIVSDLVQGVSLSDWLTGRQPSVREACKLCATIADALHHAHEAGVIHRDLKPHNIMLVADSEPRLLDFGLARRNTGEITMTIEGNVLGTPAYMPPEQARGEAHQVSRQADIYSLGVILFELVTGELPFRGNARMLINQVLHKEAPSPRKLNNNIPKDLETICLKCLEKAPHRRFESAKLLADELRRFLDDKPTLTRPIPRLARAWRWSRRNPALTGMLAASVLFTMTLAVSTFFIANQRDIAEDRLVRATTAERESASQSIKLARRNYLLHVANADKALQENNYLLAQVEIDACQEEQRGWEWQYLVERIQAVFPLVLPGAEQPNYTRDDKRLIAIGAIGTPETRMVMTWNLESGKVVGDPLEHESPLFSLAVSTDNKRIVAGDAEGTLVAWDAESGDELWCEKVHEKRFDGLAFSPDGRFIATANHDSRLKVVDVTDGTVIFTTEPFKSATRKVSFSPNGRWIASGLMYGGAMLINAATGEIVDKFSEDEGRQAVSTFDPSGQRIATGNVDGSIKVWNWDGKQLDEIASWPAGNREFVNIDFNADGTRLVATDAAKAVKVWDATTGEQLAALASPGVVYWLAFNHGGDEIALFSLNGGIRIWRYLEEEDGLKVTPLDGAVEAMFNPDGNLILASSPIHFDGIPPRNLTNHHWRPDRQPEAASILDAGSGEEICTTDDPVYAASWSPDGQQIVASSVVEDAIRTYGAATGEYLQSFPSKTQRLTISRVDPTSRRLVTFSYDGMMRVLNFKSGKEALEYSVLPEKPGISHVMRAGFARNANQIGIGLYPEYRVEIWDTRSATLVSSCSAPGQFTRRFTFSDDGNRVYVGGTGGQLTEFDTVSGQVTKRFLGHTGAVLAIASSPNEDQIVSGDNSGQVIIWDVAIGCRLVTLTAGDTPVISLDWSSDGHRIVAGKVDGTVQIWTLPGSP